MATAKQQRAKKLKALGLPDSLLDADFKEKFEKATAIYNDFKSRYDELANSPEWKGVEFPWSIEKSAYKETAYEPGPELVQSERPIWSDKFDDWQKMYRVEFYPILTMRRRLKMSWQNAPAPGTKMRRLFEQKGIDPDKLMEEIRAEREAERKAERK